jgi:hypothetical protein
MKRYGRAVILLALALFCSASVRSAYAVAANPTAAEILHRWMVYSGETEANSRSTATEASVEANGTTYTEAVLSKAPDRVLIKTVYPATGVTTYFGSDGNQTWWSTSLGATGPTGPAATRYVTAAVSYYNQALIFSQRGHVVAERLPDVTLNGMTYYAVRERPARGDPDTLLFDRHSYRLVGGLFDQRSYDLCTRFERYHQRIVCLEQQKYERGRVVRTLTFQHIDANAIEDWQFAAPETPADWTTPWLLSHYAHAIHAPKLFSAIALSGRVRDRLFDGFTTAPADWSLGLTAPNAFVLTQSHGSEPPFYISTFDGASGYTQFRDGARRDASFANAVAAMAYSHCELFASQCGVSVTRTANVRLRDRLCYVVKVASRRDPSAWYSVLIDSASLLPRAAVLTGGVLIEFDDYAPGPKGMLIPTTWTIDYTNYIETATNIVSR